MAWVEVLFLFVTNFFMVLAMNALSRVRRWDSAIMQIVPPTLFLLASPVYNLCVDYESQSMIVITVLFFAQTIASICWISKDSIFRKLLVVVLINAPLMAAEIFLETYLSIIEGDYQIVFDDYKYLLYIRVISATLIASYCTFYVFVGNKQLYKKKYIPVLYVCIMYAMQLMFVSFIFRKDLATDIKCVSIILIISVLISLCSVLLLLGYIKSCSALWEKENDEEIHSNVEGLQRRYDESVLSSKNKIEQSTAEIRAVIERIRTSLYESSSKIDYSKALGDVVSEITEDYYCNNRVVNMILTLKNSKATELGIRIDYMVSIPSELEILESDISSAVSNLVDNAIEAAAECKDTKLAPYVELSIGMRNGYLVIRTENSTKTIKTITSLNDLRTNKKDTSSPHGYGIMILSALASKYNGNLSVEISNNIGIFTLIMKNEALALAENAI